ncbi:MAG: polyprenyl synthetase family protein [Methanomassiliicoccus sp.]|nr:polyprenyl synthetase family protein [Methanomassiliicoccus sp.]
MDVLKEITKRAKLIDGQVMSYLEGGDDMKLMLAVRHYPVAGGKRLRPMMAQVVAQAVGGAGDKAIPFASALEIIHNFTLVHDDVMDNDSMRRGRPAVHVLFDVPTAIIAGDALFARAFEIITDADIPPKHINRLVRMTAHTVWLIAEGQQEDMDLENIPVDRVALDDYQKMIYKKTAVLFECAAEGGALIGGGTEEQIARMKDYARLMGMGFQVWDDILALTGDEKQLGKPVGNDIRNGKRTLIVLHALHTMDPKDPRRATLMRALGNDKATAEEISAAIQVLHDCGAIDYAKRTAADYAAKAKEQLECLPPTFEREFLSGIIDFAVGRKV